MTDGWAVTFGIARRGLGGATARPGSVMAHGSAVLMSPLKG